MVIANEGEISDLNIAKLRGNHDLMSHLKVNLISPQSTSVLLFENECPTTSAFDLGLDDEAPEDIICPATAGFTYRPGGALSDFDGENPTGTWTLRIEVTNTAGLGGQLTEWQLEICSNASANSPFLVVNDTLPLPPGASRDITDQFLLSDDPDNTAEELTYTLVTVPDHGTLYFLNEPLEVGSTFRQSSLNAGNVMYVNDGGDEEFDGFTFTVEDGEGGWFGVPRFNIKMDPDVVVSNNNLEDNNRIFLFPNPAKDLLNVRFAQSIQVPVSVVINDISGRVVHQQQFSTASQQLELNTNNLASGIYFVQVQAGNAIFTERVAIQR